MKKEVEGVKEVEGEKKEVEGAYCKVQNSLKKKRKLSSHL